MRMYFTYIVSNKKRGSIYTGMTNDLIERVKDHKQKVTRSFTGRYNLDKLVWYETFPTAMEAIKREKEIKGWVRKRKIKLIEKKNPDWKDLYNDLVRSLKRKYGRMSDIWHRKGDDE